MTRVLLQNPDNRCCVTRRLTNDMILAAEDAGELGQVATLEADMASRPKTHLPLETWPVLLRRI